MHSLSGALILSDSRPLPQPSTAVTEIGLTLCPPSFGTKLAGASALLPTELVRYIFEFAASGSSGSSEKPSRRGEPSRYTLQLVSRSVRKWIHPLLYARLTIRTISRLKDFVETFNTSKAGCVDLLAHSVRDLSLLEDTSGCTPFLLYPADGFGGPTSRDEPLKNMVDMCKSVKRLFVNYMQGVPWTNEGARPQELSIQRGIKKLDLNRAPFENITKFHLRCEQLLPCVVETLPLHRLTHVCFTHHVQYFRGEICVKIVSQLLYQNNIERVIVEAQEKSTDQGDLSVRKVLAEEWPQEARLVVRLSTCAQGQYEEKVFQERPDVWDVSGDLQWREELHGIWCRRKHHLHIV